MKQKVVKESICNVKVVKESQCTLYGLGAAYML